MVDVEAQCRNSLPCCRFSGILLHCANYKSTRFGFAFGVDLPPPVNPDLRPLLALMPAEEAVLIPWSIQETSLSFRPRWLSNFSSSCSSHRESSERRNRHIFRGPIPMGYPGKCPLRDFANRVFRGMARKDAACSASTYGSGRAGKDRDCMKHLGRRRHRRAPRGERKRQLVLLNGKVFRDWESLSAYMRRRCMPARVRWHSPASAVCIAGCTSERKRASIA
jgi:hypothetical protein